MRNHKNQEGAAGLLLIALVTLGIVTYMIAPAQNDIVMHNVHAKINADYAEKHKGE